MRLLKEVRNLTQSYHVKSGMYHYFRNEYTQAEEFLRKALADDGNLTDADRRHARHYLTLCLMDSSTKLESNGDLDGCLERLQRATEVSPRFPDLHYRIGRTCEELDRVGDAIAAYEQAIACHPGYVDARVALAFCLLRDGRHAQAAVAFGEALELKKRSVEEPCRKGIELLRAGEPEEAAERFHQAFLAEPQLAEQYRRKGLAALRAEEYEKALEELDRALVHSPKYPDLHNFRGIVLHELDRLDEAIEAFRLSAALTPRYLVPRLNLAFTLVRVERYREAEAELEAILNEDPTEPAAAAKLEELRTGRPPEKRRSTPRGSTA